MNGARALLDTLSANGITTCFANPGTSEMHFVAALDDVPAVRGVLCLFEGVATGAADGYARVTGSPAAALVHLGPGLANGWANLHNARRAHSPVVVVVGDHATYHAPLDAPLQSDIGAVASALEGWSRHCDVARDVARDTADAVAAAYGPPGRVATLVVAADASWGEVPVEASRVPRAPRARLAEPDDELIRRAVTGLSRGRGAILLGGDALDADRLSLADAIARSTQSRLIVETFPAVMDRGRGVVHPERLIYLSEFALDQLRDLDTLVLIGAREPVGFFAYPQVPSRLAPDGCDVVPLAPEGVDSARALAALVDALGATRATPPDIETPTAPTGALTTASLARAVAATLPEDVIIADESNTGGVHLYGATAGSPHHRLVTLTGGAIGFGLPVAVGAALGSGQRVLALEADGSLLYTPQALWTMARENLDVTVVALSNRSYAILTLERQRVGAGSAGAASQRLLELDDPPLDLCALARGMGVPATLARSADELVVALRRSYATPGPSFIEARLPAGLS